MIQTPRILSGCGSLQQLAEQLTDQTVFLVTDQGLAKAGLAQQVAELLNPELFLSFLDGEPDSEGVERVADALQGKTGVVAGLGGGSALDLAKLAASVCAGSRPPDDYGECATPLPKGLPTVLIPTTAGTGSEMSRTAVFTDRKGRKTWAWGEPLQAEIAVLDPELTVGLPLEPTVYTAVDALSHALEAATGVNKTALCGCFARQAVSMIPNALVKVMQNLKSVEAREELLNASGFAGIALNTGGTGLAHALAHGLGSVSKVPHGVAIAWSLRVTLSWNLAASYQMFPWLADDPTGTLNKWLDTLPIPSLPEFETEQLIAAVQASENRVILDNNARPVSDHDVIALCRQLADYTA